ncbi:MAG: hypothetical protein H0W64_11410 [Gammaproteobacteria bacterium]|nr:hypothetical protein [Gammaproteobacteria bacterium]
MPDNNRISTVSELSQDSLIDEFWRVIAAEGSDIVATFLRQNATKLEDHIRHFKLLQQYAIIKTLSNRFHYVNLKLVCQWMHQATLLGFLEINAGVTNNKMQSIVRCVAEEVSRRQRQDSNINTNNNNNNNNNNNSENDHISQIFTDEAEEQSKKRKAPAALIFSDSKSIAEQEHDFKIINILKDKRLASNPIRDFYTKTPRSTLLTVKNSNTRPATLGNVKRSKALLNKNAYVLRKNAPSVSIGPLKVASNDSKANDVISVDNNPVTVEPLVPFYAQGLVSTLFQSPKLNNLCTPISPVAEAKFSTEFNPDDYLNLESDSDDVTPKSPHNYN